jgi:hypothetical protein
MRAHVEIIDERDYIWHPAEFVEATGRARQKNLSYDEEDGSVSAKVVFDTAWHRPAGVHHAETEWYVLSGQVRVGADALGAGDYWMAPSGVWTPEISVDAGTEILFFREYGDWGFDVASSDRPGVRPDQQLIVQRTNQMPWVPVEIGSPMRFDLGGTPVTGLHIKLLHRDPVTGHYTRLIHAEPGWVEHPLAHHPCYEEAYTLQGRFEYNYGSMWEGTYFFRPPLLRHGDFVTAEDTGCTWLLRSDSDLVDWYTDDARVEMHGTPLNYGEGYPGTAMPRLLQPVRSLSIGPMKDPAYQ